MIILEKGAEKKLNQLAREKMKLRLLADIKFDLQFCEIEGRNKREYLQELKQIIDGFLSSK